MVSASLIGARDPDGAIEVARARELFLQGWGADLSSIRPVIARSWYRSRAAGVDAAGDRGVLDKGRVDAQTLTAAEPLLGELDELVADIGGYVSLTAPNGVLVTPSFLRCPEGLPEGYSLLEEHCGTNGEGLALEEGRGVWLAPEEHVRQDMQSNWCFASLVRDPFHSRIRAVIGLTFPAAHLENVDPASTLLMLETVAARIGREIEARSSVKERTLLNEYLTISRRHGGAAVLAMDGKNSLMNSLAINSLAEGDISVVSGYARSVMTSVRSTCCEVNLNGPGMVTLEMSPVQLTRNRVGAVVVIRPHSDRGDAAVGHESELPADVPSLPIGDGPAAEFDGVSAEFQRTLGLVRKAVAEDRSVALVGEPGTGKHRLALAMSHRFGDRTVIDCRENAAPGSLLTEDLERALGKPPAALVLENADAIGHAQAQELVKLLTAHVSMRVFMTYTRSTDETLLIREVRNVLEIAVPPLRNRREDIPILARAFAMELGGRDLSRRLLTALTDSDWPHNIDQLRAVVSNAIEGSRGPEVTVDDLPHDSHRALTKSRLSRLEDAELAELRRALQEAKGNRRLAAELLQIGRSTLYRRMDYFRSRGFDL